MNPVALTAALVEFDSRNPILVPGAPGEDGVARFLGDTLANWGFDVTLTEAAPGRPNLIARIGRPKTNGGARSLMLNGHLDVVGTEGMTHSPWSPTQEDGRLYGRGSADMKSGIAAMCVAARDAAQQGLDGEVIVACVIDEEYDSAGTRALIAHGIQADAAIVTEPTQLAICPAHRGFVWVDLEFTGRAAHGSRYDLGQDAITHAALVVAQLDRHQREVLTAHTHPLLGRASLHASTIKGGVGYSTYPESCTLAIERRTVPGETTEDVFHEIEDAIARVRAQHPSIKVAISVAAAQGTSDVAVDAPIVTAISETLRDNALPVQIKGMPAWTDCALLNAAGIPAVCFGPGDISMAHAAEEFVPTQEIDDAARVLRDVILRWCNSPN